jgi:hypothetical protein
VFDLTGHPTAARAYAWSSEVTGSDRPRLTAVLHGGPVDSPEAAVRASIAADLRGSLKEEAEARRKRMGGEGGAGSPVRH